MLQPSNAISRQALETHCREGSAAGRFLASLRAVTEIPFRSNAQRDQPICKPSMFVEIHLARTLISRRQS